MMNHGGAVCTQLWGLMTAGYSGHAGWMHFWGGGLVMWIVLVVVIGLIVYLIVVMTRQARNSHQQTTHSESAREILEKRYARGEISKEDFERMKEDIS